MSDEKTENATEAQHKNIPLQMDEIIKMLFTLSDELTIKMINSLFKKNYPTDAKLTFEKTEMLRFSETDDRVEKLHADMILTINSERYHIEFQTLNESSILPRMFEYGFIISIEEAKRRLTFNADGMAQMDYPKQYIIFVERNEALTKNEMTMQVKLWDGDIKEYTVPILRYWNETADTLEAKHLEPLLPLQIFNIRKDLESIKNSKKPEVEKEKLAQEKLREVIKIYKDITQKVHDLTENKGRLTTYNAEQMLRALRHFSAYLYYNYKGYKEIEKEAVQMSEAVWSFDKWHSEGEKKRGKETAYEMFKDSKNIKEIRKYSKLSDKDLADVLITLPQAVQSKYNLAAKK